MVEKEQVRPLTMASPATAGDEESASAAEASRWRSAQYLRKRRGILCCCGCCAFTVVVVGFVVLVLAFTVFKVKDPVLTLNSIRIDAVDAGVRGGATGEQPISANASLTADISIKNPNVASFKFCNSTTEFSYEGVVVGAAYAPGGKVSADRTVRMNVTVDVLADRVVAAAKGNTTAEEVFFAAFAGGGGSVNLTSFTEITGRVNVIGVFKRYLDVMLNCSMTLDISLGQQEVKNKVCRVKTR